MLYIERRAAQSDHLSQLTAGRVCEILLTQDTHHTMFIMTVQVMN
jgi:hypothetical protein